MLDSFVSIYFLLTYLFFYFLACRLIHNRVREVFGHSGRVGQANEGQEDMYTVSYYRGGEKE